VPDKSNGYEAIAEAFSRTRSPSIGPGVVRNWAKQLRPGASILDLGCGNGVPITATLIQDGFEVYGVDASATLVAQFRDRFPDVAVDCNPVEESVFFNRTFDAAIAWGLLFLLPAETQRALVGKVARVLNQGGHFLFTAPRQVCSWKDGMTGLLSVSLGQTEYERELAEHGLALVGNNEDEGGNYHYFATKNRLTARS
jgi:SAM-dependent methyltransferase